MGRRLAPWDILRQTAAMARPSRLLTAYLVTARVTLSYVTLALSRRFRSAESFQRATHEKHQRNARRIEAGIIRLRGLFIKVGQLISIMANFLPDAFREELRGLQDQVPPRPYEDIEARLREEFGGRAPSEVFAEFNAEPVASASIGQVHIARLQTGERVAVKVQYPDIEDIVRTDLRALRRIFGLLRWFMPDYGFDTIYREIREMVLAELDFRLEAAHIDRRKAARICVEAYCQQIFVDGLYHADPHPGNLLLQPPAVEGEVPTVVFLDFG